VNEGAEEIETCVFYVLGKNPGYCEFEMNLLKVLHCSKVDFF